MQQQIVSITQLNDYLKARMDSDPHLSSIAVRGEISNYKVYPSGHHYFTLKDETSQLRCTMFKSSAMRLRFKPVDGMKVIAMGSVSVYVRDGRHQLQCTAMAIDGIGDLYAQFEELKKRLEAQGLFDPAHKKPLPKYPGVIGVVTSEVGAAIHDILRILRARYPLAAVRLLPVRVQGREAPDEIAGAIYYANQHKLADLLIVGRGGGSIEDLWAFNDERVARAIYASEIPIISAVGHEPDVTISDYVADRVAATPSNAAEIAVPDQNALRQYLDSMEGILHRNISRRLQHHRQQLDSISGRPVLKSPLGYYELKKRELQNLEGKLTAIQQKSVLRQRSRFVAATSKLDAMSPLKVLTRGYSVTTDVHDSVIRSFDQVAPGDEIRIRLSDGSIKANVIEGESIHE